MKKHISILASALAVLSMGSCSKDTEGLTQITYYAVITLDGPVYDQVVAGFPLRIRDILQPCRVRTSPTR